MTGKQSRRHRPVSKLRLNDPPPGLYSIGSPRQLYEKVRRDFDAFYRQPTIDGLFSVLFPLYHLREWICPGGHERYEHKSADARSDAERFHAALHAMPEYGQVRDLCNHAKHLGVPEIGSRTEILEGLRVGLGGCNDALDVTHFVIDNREIRDVFWTVYIAYTKYFEPLSGKQA